MKVPKRVRKQVQEFCFLTGFGSADRDRNRKKTVGGSKVSPSSCRRRRASQSWEHTYPPIYVSSQSLTSIPSASLSLHPEQNSAREEAGTGRPRYLHTTRSRTPQLEIDTHFLFRRQIDVSNHLTRVDSHHHGPPACPRLTSVLFLYNITMLACGLGDLDGGRAFVIEGERTSRKSVGGRSCSSNRALICLENHDSTEK